VIDIFFIGNDWRPAWPQMGENNSGFILPHLAVGDLGHEHDLKVMLHCCGGIAPLKPAMI
jgi:hypothetical protein